MSTISSASQVPIDVAISQAYLTAQADAAADLYDVIDQIEANSQRKEHLRKLSQRLTEARAKVDAGEMPDMSGLLNYSRNVLEYGDHSPIVRTLQTPPTPPGGLPAAGQPFPTDNDEALDAMNGWLDNLENIIKGELDKYSDIGAELQVTLNTKSSTFRRTEKSVADNEKEFSSLKDQVARNYSG